MHRTPVLLQTANLGGVYLRRRAAPRPEPRDRGALAGPSRARARLARWCSPVLDHQGAGGRAVADPQFDTVNAVIGAEEKRCAYGGQASGE